MVYVPYWAIGLMVFFGALLAARIILPIVIRRHYVERSPYHDTHRDKHREG